MTFNQVDWDTIDIDFSPLGLTVTRALYLSGEELTGEDMRALNSQIGFLRKFINAMGY